MKIGLRTRTVFAAVRSASRTHMEKEMEKDTEKYRKAKERVRALSGFYVHLINFVWVNILLAIINVVASPDQLWFFWPLLGWGIGIAAHAVSVFGFGRNLGFLGKDWEERKLKELVENQS